MTEHDSEGRAESEEFSHHIGRRAWTIVALLLVWMLSLPIWWFHWAADLTDAQRMAVVILSILLFLIVLFGLWLPWSMRHGDEGERRIWEDPWYRSRFWVSTVVCLGSMAVVTYWLWVYADDIGLGSVMFLVIMLTYVGLVVGPAPRLYKGEMED